MTMKNELILKHGVIIAAAVLLIACIAFAGAGAAEVHKTLVWSTANVSKALEDGGYYDVEVSSGSVLTKVSYSGFVTTNVTFDFKFIPYSLDILTSQKGEGVGGLFNVFKIKDAKVVTFKNLIIDGGTVSSDNTMCGGFIGFIHNYGTTNPGVVVFENVSVKNITVGIEKNQIYSFCGGYVGGVNTLGLKFENCSLESSAVKSSGSNCGGLLGYAAEKVAVVVKDCLVDNSVIKGVNGNSVDSAGAGGLVGHGTDTSSIVIINSSVMNSILDNGCLGKPSGLLVGCKILKGDNICAGSTMETVCRLIGGELYCSVKIIDCDGIGSVVKGDGKVGGLLGYIYGSGGQITASDNNVCNCTVISTGSDAGGFVGFLKPYTVASISGNRITNSCVVATNGNAAGFIAGAS